MPPLDPLKPLVFAALDHRAGHGRSFGIRPGDLSRHMYVLGKTGTGKSTLLEKLIVEQILAGEGVGLLDPHGDLVSRVLDRIPRHRSNEVVLLDAGDVEHPVGLNLLACPSAKDRPRVVSGVLALFRKVYGEFWGPRLEHVYRNTLFALLEVPGTTLLAVPRMLTEDRFRAMVLRHVRDPIVKNFWEREFPKYPPPLRAEIISPVQNKVAAVLTNPLLRNIVGQPRSTISAATIMDEGRIFLADLAKGRIGEDACALLGTLLVSEMQLATYRRVDVAPAERRGFTLYVDEFPSFVSPMFGELLSEARKYGLGLVLAHQYLGQLDEGLRRAVLGNVGSMIVFRVGAEDAETLAPEFTPELSAHDLARLSQRQIALKLCVDGRTSDPFTATTLAPETPTASHAETIRRVSRERYGVPREKVERLVADQLGAGASETA